MTPAVLAAISGVAAALFAAFFNAYTQYQHNKNQHPSDPPKGP